MQVHLGPGTACTHLDLRPADDEALLAAVEDGTHWNQEGRWTGWERAGQESFMRRGYASQAAYQQGEEPVIIEKSGNPGKTYRRGTVLEDAGADIVPTCMVITDGGDPDTKRLKGGDYRIFQMWTPGSFAAAYENRVAERGEERPSPLQIPYSNREETGVLTDDGVASFSRTCAAIDREGFRVKSGDAMIQSFLTDTDRCYLVDFGEDLGTWGEPHTVMYNAARDFLDVADWRRFEKAYLEACDGR